MATFKVEFLNRRGQRRVELMDAIDAAMVRQTLAERKFWIVSVAPSTRQRYRHATLRVSRKQLLMSLEALKLLISSGAKIERAMRVAVEQAPAGKLRYVLTVIAEGTEGGNFAANFAQFPYIFPDAVVEILKANQESGNIEQGLEQVCSYYTRMEEIRGNVLKGIFVPIMGICAFVAAFGVIFGFTLPRFKTIFAELVPMKDMPTITRWCFGISDFVCQHTSFLIIALVACLVLLWRAMRHKKVQIALLYVARRLPAIGPAILSTALARFSTTYADLTKAGFKTIPVLEMCSRVVAHATMSLAIHRIRDSILQNNPVGASFSKEKVFPPEFLTAVSIGEDNLEFIFRKLSEHYSRESKKKIDMAIATLEPAMSLVLGGLAFIAGAAVMLPIVQVIQRLSSSTH